jgi:hypothetical protein
LLALGLDFDVGIGVGSSDEVLESFDVIGIDTRRFDFDIFEFVFTIEDESDKAVTGISS